jgi:hypothetical protein
VFGLLPSYRYSFLGNWGYVTNLLICWPQNMDNV